MKTTLTLTMMAALLAMGAGKAGASDITITDTGLAGLIYVTPGPGATAEYVPTDGGYAQLTSPDNVGGGHLPQLKDSSYVVVENGYEGVDLGTLNSFAAEGAAGDVSFTNKSEGGPTGASTNGQYAYWALALSDPSHPATVVIINAYSDDTTGANPFNDGSDAVFASASYPGHLFPFGSSWATVESTMDHGSELGTWNVVAVGIGVGGWDTGIEGIADISSITLPGSGTLAVPEPSTWALFLGGMGALVVFGRRRSQLKN